MSLDDRHNDQWLYWDESNLASSIAYDERLIPDDTQMILDAYENDDFWLPPEGQNVAMHVQSPSMAVPSSRYKREPGTAHYTSTVSLQRTNTLPMRDIAPDAEAVTTTSNNWPIEVDIQAIDAQLHPPSQNVFDWNQLHAFGQPNYRYTEAHQEDPIRSASTVPAVLSHHSSVHTAQYGNTKQHTKRNHQSTVYSRLSTHMLPSHARTGSHGQPPAEEARYSGSDQGPHKKAKVDPTSPTSPVTPLTAYNFFFRYERNRLLQASGNSSDPYAWIVEHPFEFQEMTLQDQWGRDRTVKRKHRKTHGKISFQEMTRQIAASWRTLPEPVKRVFQEISAQDCHRYDQEIKMDSIEQDGSDPGPFDSSIFE